MLKKKERYNVAVVGATGAVGNEMISVLEEREFPVENLRLFASERSEEQSSALTVMKFQLKHSRKILL